MQLISNLDALAARLDAERHGHRRVYRVGATPNPALRLIPPAYTIARKTFPICRRGGRRRPRTTSSRSASRRVFARARAIIAPGQLVRHKADAALPGDWASLSAAPSIRPPADMIGSFGSLLSYPLGPAATRTDTIGHRTRVHARRMQSTLPLVHQLRDAARLRGPGSLRCSERDAAWGGESRRSRRGRSPSFRRRRISSCPPTRCTGRFTQSPIRPWNASKAQFCTSLRPWRKRTERPARGHRSDGRTGGSVAALPRPPVDE